MEPMARTLQAFKWQHPESKAVESPADCECGGSGWTVIVGEGARKCECYRKAFTARKLAKIPAIYDGLDLDTITPDASRYHDQARVIAFLRANPESSYAFTGNLTGDDYERPNDQSNRTGKSLFGWLLYRKAVLNGRRAYGFVLSALLNQFQAWEMNAERVPELTPFDLQQSHTRYLILLDELDKARPTEFRAEKLFELIEAAHSYRHQLIVTTNYTLDGLVQHWSRNGVAFGPAIVSRLREMPDGYEQAMY